MKFHQEKAGKFGFLVLFIFVLASCGKLELDLHFHTYENVLSKDSTGHWYAATCEHKSEKKGFKEHVSSGPATETQAEVCTVCGYEINPVVIHVHTYSENLSSDSTGHWYAATCKHSTEKKDFAEHVSSGPATETQAEVCTVCGYEINPVVIHVHTYSENLSSDSTGHWYAATCEHKSEKKGFKEHVSSSPATETQAEVCTVCGYEINPVVIIPKAAFSISDEHVLKMEIPDEVLSEYKKEGTQISVVLNINMEKTYIDNVVRKTILLSEFREKEEIDFSEILSWYDLYFALHENKYFVEIILCDSDGKQVKTLETLEKSSDGLDFTGLPKITLENNEIKISKFSEERLAKLKERGAIGQIHVLSMSKEDPAFKENTVGNWDKVWLFDKYFDMDHIPESIKLADIINYTEWKDVLNSNGDIFVDIRFRNKMEWDEDTVVYYWSGSQKLEWKNWKTEIDNLIPFTVVNDDYVGLKLKINESFIPETAAILRIKINDKQVYRVDKNTAKVHETEWLFPYVIPGESCKVSILYNDENWGNSRTLTRWITPKKGLGNIEIISEPEVTISDAGKLKYTTLPELKIGNTVVKGDVIPENGVFKSVIYKNEEWYHSATWGNGYAWDRVSDNLSNEWDIAKTLIDASKKTNEEELSFDLIYFWKDESGYEYQYPILDKGKYNFKIDWAAYEEANNNGPGK
ncbi:MAG: hypothetical protein MJ182_06780 [Treponema sp.]|nr:hypothetical protein [Treponema sp.]